MEAESGASRSGGGSGEIEDWCKAIVEAVVEGVLEGRAQWKIKNSEAAGKKMFQQWTMKKLDAQGNTVMDAEEGFDLKKNTAKRKAPPQGNTVMDAEEGLELKKPRPTVN